MPIGLLVGIGIGWVVIWFVFRRRIAKLEEELEKLGEELEKCRVERDEYRHKLNDSNVSGF